MVLWYTPKSRSYATAKCSQYFNCFSNSMFRMFVIRKKKNEQQISWLRKKKRKEEKMEE